MIKFFWQHVMCYNTKVESFHKLLINTIKIIKDQGFLNFNEILNKIINVIKSN
jgi:hypothetical protein